MDVSELPREEQVQPEVEDVPLVEIDPVDHGVAAHIEQLTSKQNGDIDSWRRKRNWQLWSSGPTERSLTCCVDGEHTQSRWGWPRDSDVPLVKKVASPKHSTCSPAMMQDWAKCWTLTASIGITQSLEHMLVVSSLLTLAPDVPTSTSLKSRHTETDATTPPDECKTALLCRAGCNTEDDPQLFDWTPTERTCPTECWTCYKVCSWMYK